MFQIRTHPPCHSTSHSPPTTAGQLGDDWERMRDKRASRSNRLLAAIARHSRPPSTPCRKQRPAPAMLLLPTPADSIKHLLSRSTIRCFVPPPSATQPVCISQRRISIPPGPLPLRALPFLAPVNTRAVSSFWQPSSRQPDHAPRTVSLSGQHIVLPQHDHPQGARDTHPSRPATTLSGSQLAVASSLRPRLGRKDDATARTLTLAAPTIDSHSPRYAPKDGSTQQCLTSAFAPWHETSQPTPYQQSHPSLQPLSTAPHRLPYHTSHYHVDNHPAMPPNTPDLFPMAWRLE
jgi:hypothetical protein